MGRVSRLGWVLALGIGLTVLIAAPARASTVFDFYNLTNNSSGLINPGDLWMEVSPVSLADPAGFTYAAQFTIHNDATTGSIEEVYWYEVLPPDVFNGSILLAPGWVNPANPPNLPGFDWSPLFVLAASGEEEQGGVDNAIKPGGSATFTLGLLGDVYDALIAGLESCAGNVLVGIHVQQIGPDDISDSFTTVPVPPAVAIGLLGLGLLGTFQARRHMKSKK